MSFYRNVVPNQKIGIATNPLEGLNEYSSPVGIRDNQFSDCLNVFPEKDTTLKFNPLSAVGESVSPSITGVVNEAISDMSESGDEYIYTIGHYSRDANVSWTGTTVAVTLASHGLSASDWFLIQLDNYESKSALYQVGIVTDPNTFLFTGATSETLYDTCKIIIMYFAQYQLDAVPETVNVLTNMGSIGLPLTCPENHIYSSCLFSTEAKNYVVFSCDGVKKLFHYDGTTLTSVTTPFYPVKLIAHANRIFAIDDKNKLWWSKAGTFINVADWYGSGTTESSVVKDSGYWTVEQERKLTAMALLNNTLYLFGRNNIYAFSGYDYDTFALQVAVPDYGVESNADVTHLTQTGNVIYFISEYLNISGNTEYELYEFDGASAPVLISKPVIVNESIRNGILGSVDLSSVSVDHISSDEQNVFLHKRYHSHTVSGDKVIYIYNVKRRTWWKYSGYNGGINAIGDESRCLYVSRYNRNSSVCLVSSIDNNETFVMSGIGSSGESTTPFVITKAFSSLPTDRQTLTSIALQFRAEEDADLYIKVSISKTENGDDFETIKEYDHYTANGNIEVLEMFLPIRLVARTQQYRLKIEIGTSACNLFTIERRYRTTGRSR